MHKSAVLSPCERYRYFLSRTWESGPLLPFVMLNPSTADHQEDDPTIRTCIRLAMREGYAGLFVVNLFAWRATKPEAMKAEPDPHGPSGQQWLVYALDVARKQQTPIIAAWGAHGAHRGAGSQFRALANVFEVPLLTLGVVANGEPRHPLYMRNDAPLLPLT